MAQWRWRGDEGDGRPPRTERHATRGVLRRLRRHHGAVLRLLGVVIVGGLVALAARIERARLQAQTDDPRRMLTTHEVALRAAAGDPVGLCRVALVDVGARKVAAGRTTNEVTAEMRPSWRGVGERVAITVKPIGDLVEFSVSSWSKSPVAVIDYGKNRRNVEMITAALEQRSGTPR